VTEFPNDLRLEPLTKGHVRAAFDCGQAEVSQWLRTKALQHQQKRLSSTKALVDSTRQIAGFYTLATAQIDFGDLPATVVQHLPRRALPAAIIVWLGVATSQQGQHLGDLLLARALRDCHEAGKVFAFVAVILDCVDERAKTFYSQWNFRELEGQPFRLYLSAAELDRLMTEESS
jgi:GNAT superfamily N-acetyltransferase